MAAHAPGDRLKITVVTLGCAKNRIDSEEILGMLGSAGYLLTDAPEEADLVIVNTCAFIEEAQAESVDTILSLAHSRRAKAPLIVAAGCLVERYGEKLLRTVPELSGVIGVHSYTALPGFLERCLAGKRETRLDEPPAVYRSLGPRLLTRAPHSVYVKIAEGCNNRCCYCLIPSLRGPYRSSPVEEITAEVEDLVKMGAREVNLIAHDTTAYGSGLTGSPNLAGLLAKLLTVPGSPWLRLLYTHPSNLTGELLEMINSEPRICSYLDLPLQHINSTILHKMGRPYSRDAIVSLVEHIRRDMPGMALRTTYLVGFPGERRAHFRELLAFLYSHPFERVGVFAYSRQPGTASENFDGQVHRRVREKRRRELMTAQQIISLSLNRKLAGKRVTVLVDRQAGPDLYYGRTRHQAPEVDGGVYFRSKRAVVPGTLVSVKISAVSPYHLLGGDPSFS